MLLAPPGEGAAAPDPLPAPGMSEPAFSWTDMGSQQFEEQKGQAQGASSERGFLIPWCGNGIERIPWRPDCLQPPSALSAEPAPVLGVEAGCLLDQSVSWCLFKGDLLSVTPSSANDSGVSSSPP